MFVVQKPIPSVFYEKIEETCGAGLVQTEILAGENKGIFCIMFIKKSNTSSVPLNMSIVDTTHFVEILTNMLKRITYIFE